MNGYAYAILRWISMNKNSGKGTWLIKVLLQVFVTFYTMIATIRQHNVPVRCDCYSLRSIYLASRGVNEGEE